MVEFFRYRIKFLKEIFFKKVFEVENYLIKYEFQGRGTIHAHVLIWLKNTPPLSLAYLGERIKELYLENCELNYQKSGTIDKDEINKYELKIKNLLE